MSRKPQLDRTSSKWSFRDLVRSRFMSEPSAKREITARAERSHDVDMAANPSPPQLPLHRKGLVPPMQIKIIASLVMFASAGAAAQAHPAASVVESRAAEALDKQRAHAAAIATCEAMWDGATHMTKTEWSRTCRRVQNRLRKLELR
jgi:hypothetical protein